MELENVHGGRILEQLRRRNAVEARPFRTLLTHFSALAAERDTLASQCAVRAAAGTVHRAFEGPGQQGQPQQGDPASTSTTDASSSSSLGWATDVSPGATSGTGQPGSPDPNGSTVTVPRARLDAVLAGAAASARETADLRVAVGTLREQAGESRARVAGLGARLAEQAAELKRLAAELDARQRAVETVAGENERLAGEVEKARAEVARAQRAEEELGS
jgi:hypothetical protein